MASPEAPASRGLVCLEDERALPLPGDPRERTWQGSAWRDLVRRYGVRTWPLLLADPAGGGTAPPAGGALLQELLPTTMTRYWGHAAPGLGAWAQDFFHARLLVNNGPLAFDADRLLAVHEALCLDLRRRMARGRHAQAMVRPAFGDLPPDALPALDALYARHGFAVRPCHTFLAPVALPEAALRARLASEKRTKVNKAQRLGLQIELATDHAGVERYWRVRLDTWRRNGQEAVPLRHFLDTWDVLRPHGAVEVLLCTHEGHDLAGQTAFLAGGVAELSGVCVSALCLERSLPGNDYLQWGVLDWARQRGLAFVDYVGATPDAVDPKQRAIHAFKKSWGGELMEGREYVLTRQSWREGLLRAASLGRRALADLAGRLRPARNPGEENA